MSNSKKLVNYIVVALFSFSVAVPTPVIARDSGEKVTELDSKFRDDLLRKLSIMKEYQDIQAAPEIGIAIIDDDFGDEELDAHAYPERYQVIHGYNPDNNGVGYTPEFLKSKKLPLDKSFYPLLKTTSNVNWAASARKPRRTIAHGLLVAQSLLGVIGRHARVKFYFLNGDYHFNYAAAAYYAESLYRQGMIRTVISAVGFTSAGIGNSRGPLDTIVGKVLADTGLVWIQASGNDGGHVWAGKAKRLNRSKYIQFRNGGKNTDCLRFTNDQADNDISVYLVWDGGQTRLNEGTNVDYDVEVLDPRGRLMLVDENSTAAGNTEAPRGSSGSEIQRVDEPVDELPVPKPPEPGIATSTESSNGPTLSVSPPAAQEGTPKKVVTAPKRSKEGELAGESFKSKEEVTLPLQPQTKNGTSYCIRVRAESDTTRESDDLQVIIRSSTGLTEERGKIKRSVTFLDANKVNEMLPPATAAGVVSVGNYAPHSSRAQSSAGRQLPIAQVDVDTLYFENGDYIQGTSFTAPVLAGLKLLLETLDPNITRMDLFAFLQDEPGPVTLAYVRKNQRNGETLINKLLDQVAFRGVTESNLKAYLYPEGEIILTLPEHPGTYLNHFPAADASHQEDFNFFIGLRGPRDQFGIPSPVAFSTYRFRGSKDRAAGRFPWEDPTFGSKDPAAWAPYDLQRARTNLQYERADFLMLERDELPQSARNGQPAVDYNPYARTDSGLREGTPRDVPRKSRFVMPGQYQYRRFMERR